MKSILFYDPKGKFGELSNFYIHKKPLNIDGKDYKTVEHWFQSQKFKDSKENVLYSELIRKSKTPNIAKILANQKIGGGYKWRTLLNISIKEYLEQGVKICDNWEEIKDDVMYQGLYEKFTQDKKCRDILLSTDTIQLFEHTNIDFYWGDGGDIKTGKNRLGELLQNIRKQLIQDNINIFI